MHIRPLPLFWLPRLKLVDIAEQFAVVLHALPFVAPLSRDRALNALKDFATKDVPAPPPPVALRPGSTVFIYNRHFQQCLANQMVTTMGMPFSMFVCYDQTLCSIRYCHGSFLKLM